MLSPFLIGLYVFLLAIFASTAVYAVMAKDAPESVTIDDCVKKKSAVEFPHKLHFETNSIECTTCHHTQTDLVAGADLDGSRDVALGQPIGGGDGAV